MGFYCEVSVCTVVRFQYWFSVVVLWAFIVKFQSVL